MLIKFRIIASLILISTSFTLLSWGVIGHRSVGKITENHLSKKAKANVEKLLGTESLAMVSTYADEVRPYSEFQYTAPWHYVNIPHGLSYDDFKTTLTTLQTPNLYKALLQCVEDLKNPSKTKEDKVFALKFLVHLVGDLHQPMHMGRAEDLGGNRIKITLMRREGNLHSLWDSSLINYSGMSYSEFANECDNLSAKEIRILQNDDVVKWAYESYQISQQLYAEAEKDPDFDFAYYPKHADMMKKRIAQAGVRLAGLLNAIYK